jgi:tRNA 5-methylaminomethyl-2-thiouridine biosynthesis bifunctional protein
MTLTPARITRREDGTPYAPDYDDVYHSDDGGPAQAREVFLAGNQLPVRWANREVFTVLETGFGLGLNFLVTLKAWRDDTSRCKRLHYIAIEKHPLTLADLKVCHAAWPELADKAAALQAQWPLPLPGHHRLHFFGGAVTLTLAFGDIADTWPQLDAPFDACYLDGFAPARNPDMWQPALLRHCGRLAAPGATLATYTTAPAVRDALTAAGFSVQRLPGYGHKRHRSAATFSPPAWQTPRAIPLTPKTDDRKALIIGAGLAGAAVAERLAARGWQITVIDALPAAAGGASGIRAGLLHPHLSPDDALLSRLIRHGFLYALSTWKRLSDAGHPLSGACDGMAHVAQDLLSEAGMVSTASRLGLPGEYAQFMDRSALSAACGLSLSAGGYWYPQAGWMAPATLIEAQLKQSGAQRLFDRRVEQLQHQGGQWQAIDANGAVIAQAPVAILANSHDAARLSPIAYPLQRVRGQLTYLPGATLAGLRHAVTGPAYAVKTTDDTLVIGSTYNEEDASIGLSAEDHAANLAMMGELFPDHPNTTAEPLSGFVGFRAGTADHLPLIGALPDLQAMRSAGLELAGQPVDNMPRRSGLYGALGYGSRGLVWAAMGGELLASLIHGEPLPVEAPLAAAMDPARGALRRLRQGELP